MATVNVDYFDKKIGWLVYPIIGISFIFFANDNDLEKLVQLPSFKWDIVFSLVVVFIIGFYLAWLVRFLDKDQRLSWENNFVKRVTMQVLYGIAIPLMVAIGLEIVYLKILKIDLSESSILNLELPLAFLYLFLINLLYYLNYISVVQSKNKAAVDLSSILDKKVKILSGAKESLMPIGNIALLKSEDKLLWLYTFEGRQLLISGNLKEWEVKLPDKFFYRLNRQMIAHKDTIKGLESTKTRRMLVILKNIQDDIYLPKSKVTDFRKWWNN